MSDLRKAAQAALDALELSAPDVRHANYAQNVGRYTRTPRSTGAKPQDDPNQWREAIDEALVIGCPGAKPTG